jgi:hypothetical protein
VASRTPTKRSRTCWWWRIGKNRNKNSKGFKNPQLNFNTEHQLCVKINGSSVLYNRI